MVIDSLKLSFYETPSGGKPHLKSKAGRDLPLGAASPREDLGSQHRPFIAARALSATQSVNIALACGNSSHLCMRLCFTMKPEHSEQITGF